MWRITVAVGDRVEAGTVVAIIEAMKMECAVESPMAGTVAKVFLADRAAVSAGTRLMAIRPAFRTAT